MNRIREFGAAIDAQIAGAPIDRERASKIARRWWVGLASAAFNGAIAVGYALWAHTVLALFLLVPLIGNVIYMAFAAGFSFNNRLQDRGRARAGLWNEFRVIGIE